MRCNEMRCDTTRRDAIEWDEMKKGITASQMQQVAEHESDLKSPLTMRSIGTKYILSCCASFVAESVYTGFRMGIYEMMRAAILDEEKQTVFPVWLSAICGLVSGAVAQFLASPTDLVKVQMQTEGLRKLHNLQPKFRNSLHAFVTLYKRNGFFGMWTGWLPNTQRAALLNMADLATYDRTKHWLMARGYNDNWITHFFASAVAGIVSAVISTPADVVKTRLMDQIRCTDEKLTHHPYQGPYDCWKRICRDEGFFALYKGFVPSYIRSAPWSLVFWVTYEEIRRLVGISGF